MWHAQSCMMMKVHVKKKVEIFLDEDAQHCQQADNGSCTRFIAPKDRFSGWADDGGAGLPKAHVLSLLYFAKVLPSVWHLTDYSCTVFFSIACAPSAVAACVSTWLVTWRTPVQLWGSRRPIVCHEATRRDHECNFVGSKPRCT